jgi:ubiquinone/menaquinone biosynthesis C-methylase UbiE
MRKQILHYYGEIHAPYLHAHGEAGTEFLLEELAAKNNECILEFGFGTGATLVKIKARQPMVNLYGLDRAETMLQKAGARLHFCGLLNVTLQKADPGNTFPFADNMFDKIYAESVLGIQDGTNLELILLEMRRILKPNGRIVLNETVWLPAISHAEIKKINDRCKAVFGIIQANADYPNTSHWLQLIHKTGFSNAYAKPIVPVKKTRRFKMPELLSSLYTFFGKLKKINSARRKEMSGYEKNMNSIYENKQYMEGVLFVAFK